MHILLNFFAFFLREKSWHSNQTNGILSSIDRKSLRDSNKWTSVGPGSFHMKKTMWAWAHYICTRNELYPYWGELWSGFFPQVASPLIGKNKFPTSGLAGVVKANSHQAAKQQMEEFVFTTTAKPWVEKSNRPYFSSVRM